jgi:hypothetical protein
MLWVTFHAEMRALGSRLDDTFLVLGLLDLLGSCPERRVVDWNLCISKNQTPK